MGKAIIFRLLTMVAILLIIAIYFSPIWWVSPDYSGGSPINFHANGVFNGRQLEESKFCDEIMYFVYELDILNHFLGMYPTASGAPVEHALSQFLFAFLIILLIAFMISGRKLQAATLSVGFSIIVAWGYLTLFTPGGITWMSSGYQQFVQCDMDMEPEEIQDWSGFYTMQESYRTSLSKTFQKHTKTTRMVDMMTTVAYVVIGVLIVSMLIFIMGIFWKNNLFYWLLMIIPILLPVFFVLDYAAWLWWVGHNLGPWATITLEPFTPTVLGESQVYKFTTHSYPHYGYGLMMLSSVLLILAGLLRRKQLRENSLPK